MDVTKITSDFEDERGSITDILRQEPIDYVTIITSKKGALRGNHVHKETVQYVYVMEGKLKALSQMPDEPVCTTVLEAGDLIVNVPNEGHAFEALEDTTFLVLTRGPRGGENYEDDTFRLETPLQDPND
ncbi:MAG: cupin domain-containing protein [Alphaproteobacteria bacterium]|jgi:dTDP-4-dehydrorhamnose 3,5-epimerase-like enzyme|nr:cupin domain-containing protein [Alphaproteobacteria bacterium]MDP7182756.1 cupin domain-containing protein [Alphaproteobacteria bacterium]MDP7456614.1 cupin domain-containing protein [Alphaproteobacteria bacterium]